MSGAAAAVRESDGHVLCEVRERVAVITLNRPERLNAWTSDMGKRYFDLLDGLGEDPGVRAVLLTGAGRGFCAGADMGSLDEVAAAGELTMERNKRPYWWPLGFGKPIVAAIAGVCFGIGLQQAMCCDVRFVAGDLRLSTVYAKRGLVGEVGVPWLLSRLVGMGAAAELLLSGRTIGAEEALRIGLAQFAVPVETLFDEAFSYARQLADGCSPYSMRTLKEQLYRGMMTGMIPAFEDSERILGEALAGPDFKEGVKAFIEKRSPDFPPLGPGQSRAAPWPAD